MLAQPMSTSISKNKNKNKPSNKVKFKNLNINKKNEHMGSFLSLKIRRTQRLPRKNKPNLVKKELKRDKKFKNLNLPLSIEDSKGMTRVIMRKILKIMDQRMNRHPQMKMKEVHLKITMKLISLMMVRKRLREKNIKKEKDVPNFIHLKKSIIRSLNCLRKKRRMRKRTQTCMTS